MLRFRGDRDLDPNSQRLDEKLNIIVSLRVVFSELKELDDLLFNAAEESFLVPSADEARPASDGRHVRMREVRDEFIRPQGGTIDFDAMKDSGCQWSGIQNSILFFHRTTWKTRGPRWELWARKLESAADVAWRKIVASSRAVIECENDVAWNTAQQELHVVDELLHHISGPDERRPIFAEELDCSLHAATELLRQMPESYPQPDTIELFKAEIRARRKTREASTTGLNADTGVSDRNVTAGSLFQNSNLQPQNPTVVGTMLLLIFVSTLLSTRGWQYSLHKPGNTTDADFWFLLQNCLMQIATSIPILFPLLRHAGNLDEYRFWCWLFILSSTACYLSAPFLYLYFPTEYSSVVAFAGSVAQAFVVLEALVATTKSKLKVD